MFCPFSIHVCLTFGKEDMDEEEKYTRAHNNKPTYAPLSFLSGLNQF